MKIRSLMMLSILNLLTLGGHAAANQELSSDRLCDILGAALTEDGPIESGIDVTFRPDKTNWRVATIELNDQDGQPVQQIRITPPCSPQQARRLVRDQAGHIAQIELLGPDLKTVLAVEPQNPSVPKASPTAPPKLALVDTGVNYLLPALRQSLAIRQDGGLYGYDFWDGDDRPFDTDPRRNIFFPLHHGTTVFSVIAAEAPAQPVAIFRFPAPEMCKFGELVDTAAADGIRIINMSMGSRDRNDWNCFEQAARRHSQILFIVSAGNDALDIDQVPIYPAALDLANILVITSGDEFGRLAAESNFGRVGVDIMVPAESMPVIDHRGVRSETGGSSYAAPRVAALAARFLEARPEANTKDIVDYLIWRTISNADLRVQYGWIPDPTDDYGFKKWRN